LFFNKDASFVFLKIFVELRIVEREEEVVRVLKAEKHFSVFKKKKG